MVSRGMLRWPIRFAPAALAVLLPSLGARSAEKGTATGNLQRTGWNQYARRFMFSPTFEVVPPSGAAAFVCTISTAGEERRAESAGPRVSLAEIWEALPAGNKYAGSIEALDARGSPIGRTDLGFFKVACFAGGYRPAKCDYVVSGRKCADYVLTTLADWQGDAAPKDVRYPALFYAAYVRLLLTDAELGPGTEKARQELLIAARIGRRLIETGTPQDWAYANMPLSHDRKVLQVCRTAMVGLAYLELAAATGEEAFLEAATRVAETLRKTQLPEGRWHFRVDPQSGKMLEDYTSDQAEAIFFLDELIRRHGQRQWTAVRDRAVRWMLENPVKTGHWQQQWDDVPAQPPYRNLEFYDTVFFALYLLRHADQQNDYLRIAGELFRYVEDQFVLWENSFDRSFVAPGVLEQYLCYKPIDWHAAHFIRLCQAMHQATGDELYLRKACALADTLTAVQHAAGYYPTWMTQQPTSQPAELGQINYGDLWPNCMSYTAETMIKFGRYLQKRANSRGTTSRG